MVNRTLLFKIILSWYSLSAFGQADDLLNVVEWQLEALVSQYVQTSMLSHDFSQDTSELRQLYTPLSSDSISWKQAESVYLANRKVIRNDKGLQLQSGVTHNFAGSVLEDDGSFYDWRSQLGLDWDLLRNGWASNQRLLKQRELEWYAEKLDLLQSYRDRTYRQTFDFIVYTFNRHKIEVIEKRLNLLQELQSVANKLFYLKFVQWEDVLDILSKKSETDLFLKNYQVYLDAVQLSPDYQGMNLQELPVFDINYPMLEDQGLDTTLQYQSIEYQTKAIDQKFHWTKDIGVRAQLRYNYYDGSLSSLYKQRDFLTAGISFSMPIPYRPKDHKRLVAAKKEKIRTEYRLHNQNLQNELLTHYYEYEYSLKQFIHFYYKKERVAVLIKRSLHQKNLSDPNYSPMQVVDRLDELYSIDLELLDIQQKLYLKALKIFSLTGSQNILPFIEVMDLSQGAARYVDGRTIHCSERDLTKLTPEFIVEYLSHHDFDEVWLQTGRNAELYLKYAQVLDLVQGSNLKVRLSLDIDVVEGSSESVLTNASFALTDALHLRFPDHLGASEYNNARAYFLSVVQEMHNKNYDISVTIPLENSQDIYSIIEPFVSSIYMMPSQSNELAGLYYITKAQNIGGAKKYQVSIKPGDFSSRLEMDNFIRELRSHLPVSAVGISSLGKMLELEGQLVGWHEERRF